MSPSAASNTNLLVLPTKYSMFGGGTIVIIFPDNLPSLDLAHTYCLVYEGSTKRHITACEFSDSRTLASRIPEHDCAEIVHLLLIEEEFGPRSNTSVFLAAEDDKKILARQSFEFLEDVSLKAAEWIVSQIRLGKTFPTRLPEEMKMPQKDLMQQDLCLSKETQRLLRLNPIDSSLFTENVNGDSIAHLCVRMGWIELLAIFLSLPSDPSIWMMANNDNLTPSQLANQHGLKEVSEVLSNFESIKTWIEHKNVINRLHCQENSIVRIRRYADSFISMTTNTAQTDTPLETDVMLFITVWARQMEERAAHIQGKAMTKSLQQQIEEDCHANDDQFWINQSCPRWLSSIHLASVKQNNELFVSNISGNCPMVPMNNETSFIAADQEQNDEENTKTTSPLNKNASVDSLNSECKPRRSTWTQSDKSSNSRELYNKSFSIGVLPIRVPEVHVTDSDEMAQSNSRLSQTSLTEYSTVVTEEYDHQSDRFESIPDKPIKTSSSPFCMRRLASSNLTSMKSYSTSSLPLSNSRDWKKKRKPSLLSKFSSSGRFKKSEKPSICAVSNDSFGHSFLSSPLKTQSKCSVCRKDTQLKDIIFCEYCSLTIHDHCRYGIVPCFTQMCKTQADENSMISSEEQYAAAEINDPTLHCSSSTSNLETSSCDFVILRRKSCPKPVHVSSLRNTTCLDHMEETSKATPSLPSNGASINSRTINEEKNSLMDCKASTSPPNTSVTDGLCSAPDAVQVANQHIPIIQNNERKFDHQNRIQQRHFAELDIVDKLDVCLLRDAWSDTLNNKYNKAFVSRQSSIWELWTTERNFLRTLLVIRYVYRELLEQDIHDGVVQFNQTEGIHPLQQLFPPCLDNLLQLHREFFSTLLALLGPPPLNIVESPVGHVLCDQFGGDVGRSMAEAYGRLNAHHDIYTRSDCLQQLMARQPELAEALQQYSRHPQAKKKSLSDCYLIVIQHLSKIKTLVPTLLAAALLNRNMPEEESLLQKANNLVHECLMAVDRMLEKAQNEEKLNEILQCFEPGASRNCFDQIWTVKEMQNRRCLFAGKLQYHRDNKEGRIDHKEKYIDCFGLLLEDALILLREKDISEIKSGGWRYTFLCADDKVHIIPFSRCQTIIREHNTGRLTSSRTPLEFLIMVTNPLPKPIAYQLCCNSHEGRDGCMTWINRLNAVKELCPFVSEQGTREAEERKDFERKKMISAEIYTRLKRTEDAMLSQISTNMQLLSQLVQLWGINSTCTELEMPEDLVCQVGKELARIALFVHSLGSSLTRSLSNADETERGRAITNVPKRAETFGGHDSKKPPIDIKRRGLSGGGSSASLVNCEVDNTESARQDASLSTNRLSVKINTPRRRSTAFLGQDNDLHLKATRDANRRRNSIGVGIFGRFGFGSKSQQQTCLSSAINQEVGVGAVVSCSSPRDSPVLEAELDLDPNVNNEINCQIIYAEQLSDTAPDAECLMALERIAQLTSQLSKDVLRLRNEVEILRAEKCEMLKELHLEKSTKARGCSVERKGYNQEHLLEAIRQQKTELDKDKRTWEELKKRERAHIDTEKERLEMRKADLDSQNEDLEKERELLREQRERFQKQIDMHKTVPNFFDSPQIDKRHAQLSVGLLMVSDTQLPQQPNHHIRWHSDETSAAAVADWSPMTHRRLQSNNSESTRLPPSNTTMSQGHKHSASTSRLQDTGCEQLNNGTLISSGAGVSDVQRKLSTASFTLVKPTAAAATAESSKTNNSTLSRPSMNSFAGGSSAVATQRQVIGSTGLGLPPLSLAENSSSSSNSGSTLKDKVKKKNKGFFK